MLLRARTRNLQKLSATGEGVATAHTHVRYGYSILAKLMRPARGLGAWACAGALGVLAGVFGPLVLAAVPVPVHIVATDLRPLIRAAIGSRVQFAVSVPHSASTATAGTWSSDGDTATWSYALRVPTAVSLSFHAVRSSLPQSAVLVVRGERTTSSYRGRDLHRGELWSRIHPGDALQLTLSVARTERDQVALNLVSLQAGYRSLGPGVSDHPYYRQLLHPQPNGSGNSSCITNYECEVNASNAPAGAASAALVIENLYQCSGVLMNDVPESNTPYVLTARHCETGALGGGNPGAADDATVYWDATTPCGASLGSIYDPSVQTQTGAQTLVEQQDAWLIRLDSSPVVSDAQLSGFDASGGAVIGGYTAHYGEGNDEQYTGWFGTAAAVQENDILGSSYVSNFWETVNQVGNIAPGASGSGLFDQNNHLVGTLTLGRETSDPSGYDSCPLPNPPEPNGSNGVADFTALAAVWNSTADTSSTTGAVTLKSVLDPNDTGTTVVPSQAAAQISFAAFNTDLFFVNTPEAIQWTAVNATACAASGGNPGDGWSGVNLPGSGSLTVQESVTGAVTYRLTCQFSGGRTGSASVSFQWANLAQVQFNAPFVVWTTRPATLTWSSDVTPCALSGGGLALTNLPASGSITTTQASAGYLQYTVTCGVPNNSASGTNGVNYVTPSLLFEANGTDRLIGQTFFLQWITQADSCTPSGGAPNDGWATTAIHPGNESVASFSPTVTTAGTYTYTLTCSSGPISLQQSVTVTFENNAPYVSAALSATTVAFSDSPADYSTLTWDSNLSTCSLSTTPNLPGIEPTLPSYDSNTPFDTLPLPQGMLTMAPAASGSFVLTVTCTVPTINGLTVSSTPVTLTVNPPAAPTAAISVNPTSVLAGDTFSISWTSTNAASCTQSGGLPNGEWGSPAAAEVPPSGSLTELAVAGSFTFTLSCQSLDPALPPATAEAALTIQALTASLSPANTSVNVGNSFTLTWSSTGATSCTASGGGANGMAWSGNVSTSGTLTQTAMTAGDYSYQLQCGITHGLSVNAVAYVKVAAASSSSSSTGGSHGGGTLDALDLGVLAIFALGHLGRRYRFERPAHIASSAARTSSAALSTAPARGLRPLVSGKLTKG